MILHSPSTAQFVAQWDGIESGEEATCEGENECVKLMGSLYVRKSMIKKLSVDECLGEVNP